MRLKIYYYISQRVNPRWKRFWILCLEMFVKYRAKVFRLWISLLAFKHHFGYIRVSLEHTCALICIFTTVSVTTNYIWLTFWFRLLLYAHWREFFIQSSSSRLVVDIVVGGLYVTDDNFFVSIEGSGNGTGSRRSYSGFTSLSCTIWSPFPESRHDVTWNSLAGNKSISSSTPTMNVF